MKLIPPIYLYENDNNNHYILREDLIPFSFGGNKVRKNINFFKEILFRGCNHVVTYGSKSSNHARVVANFSVKNSIKCTIITPENDEKATFNSQINHVLGANIIYTPLNKVKETIENTLNDLENNGERPYFIEGGGHGLIGTKAYVDAFKYIKDFSKTKNIRFDYIFLASGTGATQAGLVIGGFLNNYSSKIIGISVARDSQRGAQVIKESIEEYFTEEKIPIKNLEINFFDEYLSGGYSKYNQEISMYINKYFNLYGIPLDTTYTGKAVYGMHEYLKNKNIKNKNILFIHTGGTPLYFDYLKEITNV